MSRIFVACIACIACFAGISQAAPVASGELVGSISRVFMRFDEITEPAFTDDFILADVKLDPAYPRRFDEFSGDISGRFLGAVAMMSRSEEDDARLHRLMDALLPFQRADGRFGAASLSFSAADVGPDQMALLWGNGRLLVGLLEYYQRFPQRAEVLDAARRLGDFMLKVFDECATPEVMERVRGKAANGFICFTQYNEGLELLTRATGETAYRDAARRMEPLLEPRGDQHTHGYLTTLRGHMMIYESTGETSLLDAVEARFDDMEKAGAIMINGGLLEYFKKDYDRDEGCSEADFLRLCLQLWKATGKEKYLAYGEMCLNNIFYANQFETGDFGHRCYNAQGYMPHPGAGRAWWCCTMHGLRALRDVLDAVVTPLSAEKAGEGKSGMRMNLFQEGTWEADGMRIHMVRMNLEDTPHALAFRFVVEQAPAEERALSLRLPGWARSVSRTVTRNGSVVSGSEAEAVPSTDTQTLDFAQVWQPGDAVDIRIDCALRFLDQKLQACSLSDIPQTGGVEMAVFLGPWLLGVDADRNPMFHGEPYADNVLLFPGSEEAFKGTVSMAISLPGSLSAPEVSLAYRHGGFPDLCSVVMQPIAAQSVHPQTTVTFWHKVCRLP